MYFKQEKDYTCGLACIRMILENLGSHYIPSEEELELTCKTHPEEGTHPNEIISYLKLSGCKAELKRGGTVEQLREFKPCTTQIMLLISTDVPHCVIYKGDNNNHIFLDDPWYGENISKPIKKFERGTQYPFHRWDVDIESLKKYYPTIDTTPFESYQGRGQFITVEK